MPIVLMYHNIYAFSGRISDVSSYTDAEICELSGTAQAEAIQSGEITPIDAVEAALHRIEDLNPDLNAFSVVNEEGAIATAREKTRAIENGEDVGPLCGVPVGIKDLILTEGIRTTFGSTLYEDFVPERDSVAVKRIKDAGGIILGKTNASEFGFQAVTENEVFGTTRNPFDTRLTPGGSSGGSAAAVASGMVPVALGSDGGGSVRIPASFCGLYGLKASFGRVPLYPEHRDPALFGMNGWESVEHIGPITRTVDDSAVLLEVMSGPHHMDRHSLPARDMDYRTAVKNDIEDLVIAYSQDWGYAAVDPAVREITAEAAAVFDRELSCTVEEADPGFDDFQEEFMTIVANSTDLKKLRKGLDEYAPDLDADIVDVLETQWTAQEFTEAYKARQRLNIVLREFMQEYDLLLTPTVGVPPFETGGTTPEMIEGQHVSPEHWQSFTFQLNLTGQPAATVPAGRTDDGRPIGLQIIGQPLDDETVLQASAAYEKATSWNDQWLDLTA
jgi:aspartyl-tRNA(Asn)/glutamyl-tRNA(Gln) amidotransferase subunit A